MGVFDVGYWVLGRLRRMMNAEVHPIAMRLEKKTIASTARSPLDWLDVLYC